MQELGEIYCLTSPSGKKYIGQCVKKLSNNKKWGYISRWKDHIRDSQDINKNYCRLLNNAIRKYKPENFIIEIIKECPIDDLNYFETFYIDNFNTLTPNGYNLTSGGNCCKHSKETNELKRISMIGKNKGKVYPKKNRKREQDNNLPKYLRYYKDCSGKEGYRISHHTILNNKSFLSKKISLDEKLQLALNYLNQNTTDIR